MDRRTRLHAVNRPLLGRRSSLAKCVPPGWMGGARPIDSGPCTLQSNHSDVGN